MSDGLSTPMQPTEILIGKAVPEILIGMGEGTIIMSALCQKATLRFRSPNG